MIPLMQVVVDCAVFFALSTDDTINPDVAVKQLETIASTLKRLQDTDKQAFLRFVDNAARAEEAESGKTERATCLRSLGENLGIQPSA